MRKKTVLGKAGGGFGTRKRGLGPQSDYEEAIKPVQPPMEPEPLDPDGRIPHERVQELEARIEQLETENKKINLFDGRLSLIENRLTGGDPFFQPKIPRLEEGNLMKITQYPNRIRFDVKTSEVLASVGTHPWKTIRADVGVNKYVSVYPGTINSLVPTNIFDDISITGTGLEYAVVTLSITSGSPNSALITVTTTSPIPSVTTEGAVPTEVKDVIAIINDGIVYQVRTKNLVATSYEVFRNPVASPVYGELNYVPWYRWEVAEA